MTTPILPNIGASGLWSLSAPYAALLQDGTAYNVVAIRLLNDIIAQGGDPYTLYYAPYQLTTAQYQSDVAAGASIISLQATGGTWVYVPNTYINSMPSQNNIPYRTIVLGANLGPIPDSLDLTYVKTQVANAIQDAIGVATPLVVSMAVSAKKLISPTEDASVTASREALILANGTPTAQNLLLKNQVISLQAQISVLSAYLQTLITNGTIPGGTIPGSGTVTEPTVTATFDPSVLPAGIELTDANLTAVATSNVWQTARTTYSHASGLRYAEATITRLTGAVGFGICNQKEAPSGELGTDANGIMVYVNISTVTSGIFYLGGTIDAIGSQAPTQGSTIGIAVNLDLGLIWFYNPITEQWNGDVPDAQNPVGNVGGINIQSISNQGGVATQVFPAISTWQVSDAMTYNPGSSAFINALPTGYSAWNAET